MTALTLTSAEREKLQALIRKSAESASDGEAVAVLRLIRREAEKRGAAVLDLISAALGGSTSGGSSSSGGFSYSGGEKRDMTGVWEEPRSLAHGLQIALRFPDCLSSWEQGFAENCQYRTRFTERQAVVARRIIDFVERRRFDYGHH